MRPKNSVMEQWPLTLCEYHVGWETQEHRMHKALENVTFQMAKVL